MLQMCSNESWLHVIAYENSRLPEGKIQQEQEQQQPQQQQQQQQQQSHS